MDDTRSASEETILLKRGIEKLNAGDTSVRGELLNIACNRLMRLTSHLRRDFENLEIGPSVEEVFGRASLRLYEALHDTPIRDVRHFYQLAGAQIRRELIDVCRFCQSHPGLLEEDLQSPVEGGLDGNRQQNRVAAEEFRQWATFHDSVDALPDEQREVFELVWYHELTRQEAAELLAIPLAEARRRWRAARLTLHELLEEDRLPPFFDGF